jgi:hypothetical protein
VANTNTTTSVVNTIFAGALMALREMSVMPRYVNRQYESEAGAPYSAIDVPIPSALSASAVTPSYVPPDDDGISPSKVTLTLDKWYETAFFVNDKEVQEIARGVVDGQLSEAVRGLANQVDSDILALYKGVYGWGGVAGTTPFANDMSEFLTARAALSRQLAPKDPRYCVMDEDAEANISALRLLLDRAMRGETTTLQTGEIGKLYNVLFAMDNNMPTHTSGTYTTGYTVDGAHATTGVKSIDVTGGALGTLVEGDVITFAGHDQTYTLTAAGTGGSTVTAIAIEPGLQVALAGSEAITLKASHTVNLLFHRDAFALAARPMEASDPFGLANKGGIRRSVMDPVSGLSLTMEITRQHYRTRVALSSLYGVQLVRRELASRIAG